MLVSPTSPPQPVQSSPIHPAPIPQTACAKRKRLQDSKAEVGLPVKRPRRRRALRLKPFKEDLQKDSEAEAKADDTEPPPLSEESEEIIRTLYKELMDSAVNNASVLKRTSSRRSVVPSETDTLRSQRSSNTTAHYRYKHLEDANVCIHVDPPKEIQAAIDDIINGEPSEDRRTILHSEARKFSTRCREMVRAAAGEDDFVHLFYRIIEDISADNLISREKADWRAELKPTIQQSDANLSFISDFDAMGSDEQQDDDDGSAPPPKRHQPSVTRLYISPNNSQNPLADHQPDNRPLQLDTAKDTSLIKTPRPDITTGIKESAVISALAASLSSPGLITPKPRLNYSLRSFRMPRYKAGGRGLQNRC